MKRLTLILAVVYLCFSCEREVKLDLFVEKPIVYSSFEPDSLFRVWISQTSPPNNPFQSNPPVENAEIKVYEDGQLIHILPFMRNTIMPDIGGSYYGIDRFYPKVNSEYELEINVPGMLPAYTKGFVPEPAITPDFRILETDLLQPSAGSPDLKVFKLEIDIELDHDPAVDEYFQLVASSPIQSYKLMGADTVEYYSGVDRVLDLSEVNEALSNIQAVNNLENGGILFSDENLGAEPIRLRFFVEYDLYTSSEVKTPIEFFLQKHQKDEYLFRSSIQSIGSGNGNTFQYFSEPDVIYTNIANGVGIFSGFNPKKITVSF